VCEREIGESKVVKVNVRERERERKRKSEGKREKEQRIQSYKFFFVCFV
jgi:hypothetical protein